jgi:hypothetical protein
MWPKAMKLHFKKWFGRKMRDDEVQDMIRTAVCGTRTETNDPVSYVISGDTLVLSTKYDGGTNEVWVATVQRKGTDISQYSREDLMELVENLDNVMSV